MPAGSYPALSRSWFFPNTVLRKALRRQLLCYLLSQGLSPVGWDCWPCEPSRIVRRADSSRLSKTGPNQTVQPTGTSRLAQGQIKRHRRLAPVADLGVAWKMTHQSVLQSSAIAMNCKRLHKSPLRCLKLDHLVILFLALPGLAVAEAQSHPPEASAAEAQTQLLQFAEESVRKAGLTIARTKVLPVAGAAEKPLHRGRLEFYVTGPPKAICAWLEAIHDVDKYRAIIAFSFPTSAP